MHIARNRMWNGGATHYGISWKQSIFEDNVATGVSPTAMGSNYPQYGHSHGNPSVQNIYHHNNSQSQVWGSVSVCPASLPMIIILLWLFSHFNAARPNLRGFAIQDREMMTCDGGGGAFFGHITPLSPTSVLTAHPAQGIQPAGAVSIAELQCQCHSCAVACE